MTRVSLRMCVLVVLGAFAFLSGNAQVTTGSISGTVTDSTGAVVSGTVLDIKNVDTGISRDVTADGSGHYSVQQLALGKYEITAKADGFQTLTRSGITLTIGRDATVDISLQVGTVTQEVTIQGEAPLVETTNAAVSYLVNDRTMRDLPLNGRDMSQLILLNPGVTQSSLAGTSGFNGFNRRISISGMRGESNVYLLDGGLIGDFRRHLPAGPSGALLGLETVQEFQVLTNSYGAQYGRALGGVINAVSKSGTNTIHGSAYDYLRNSDLDARNFFDRQKLANDPRLPPFRRNQFGAAFGGPIRRDKLFFHVAYESTRESLASTRFSVVPDERARQGFIGSSTTQITVADKIKPYLNQYPLPSPNGRNFGDGTAQFIYTFKQPTVEHFGQARLDFHVSDSDSLFGRLSGSSASRTGPGDSDFPGFTQTSSLNSWLITLSETHIFSPRLLNTAAFHFNRVYPLDTGDALPPGPGITVTPGQPDPPQISPGSGITMYGGGGYATKPTYMISNRFSYMDDAILTLGSHTLEFGGMMERYQFNSSLFNRSFGVWSFSSLSDFLVSRVNTYRGAPPGLGQFTGGWRQWFFALYLQDNWRLSPRLTLNIGMRWEPQTPAVEVNGRLANLRHVSDPASTIGNPFWINKSWKNFSPRLGFAWSPTASGRTSVRAGFSFLYEPNDGNQYYGPSGRTPPTGYDFQIPSNQLFPDALAEIAAQPTLGPTSSVPYVSNKNPRALQYNLNIQQQLGASNMVSVGYVGSRGIDLLTIADVNMPPGVFNGVSVEIPTTAKLLNPNFPSILYNGNDGNSWYNGLLVSYQRQFSQGFQAQASYTFSRGIADADTGQNSAVITVGPATKKYWHDNRASKGLSGYNFTNVLSFNYSYDLPFGKNKSGFAGKLLSGWRTTGIVNIRDGSPFSLVAAVPAPLTALAVRSRSPNAIAGCNNIVLGGPDKYFNANCFSAPGAQELGNLGRNTVIGPGSATWNPALFKNTPLTERLTLEFRTEVFNVFNRANFGFPANSLFSGAATPVRIGSAGVITDTTSTSRQLQFALKLVW